MLFVLTTFIVILTSLLSTFPCCLLYHSTISHTISYITISFLKETTAGLLIHTEVTITMNAVRIRRKQHHEYHTLRTPTRTRTQTNKYTYTHYKQCPYIWILAGCLQSYIYIQQTHFVWEILIMWYSGYQFCFNLGLLCCCSLIFAVIRK